MQISYHVTLCYTESHCIIPSVRPRHIVKQHTATHLFSVASVDHIALSFTQRMTSLTGLRDLS